MHSFLKKILAFVHNKLKYTYIPIYLLVQNFSSLIQSDNLC